jgi:hypothetical protein
MWPSVGHFRCNECQPFCTIMEGLVERRGVIPAQFVAFRLPFSTLLNRGTAERIS